MLGTRVCYQIRLEQRHSAGVFQLRRRKLSPTTLSQFASAAYHTAMYNAAITNEARMQNKESSQVNLVGWCVIAFQLI